MNTESSVNEADEAPGRRFTIEEIFTGITMGLIVAATILAAALLLR